MTKALTVCLILILALSAGAVLASESFWSIYMRATDGSRPDATLRMGTSGGADTGSYQAGTGATLHAAIVNSAFGGGHLSMDIKSAIVPPQSRSWDIDVWAEPGRVVNGQLNFWSTSSMTPPVTINGTPYSYSIEVVEDPTAHHDLGTSWNFTPGATGTSNDPVGAIGFSFMNGEHVKLRLTAQPAVPEPGSMVVLGSGLIGAIAAVIRRKNH